MRAPGSILTVLLALLVPQASSSAQSFEGVVKQRTVEVDEGGLYELLYSQAGDEPDFETETEWLRYSAEKLFSISADRLLADVEGVSSEEMTIYVKGSKVRFDHAGDAGSGFLIFDAASGTSWMVSPSDRSYLKWSDEEFQAASQDAARKAEEMMQSMGLDPEEIREQAEGWEETGSEEDEGVGAPTVRPLGKTEEVNGFRASAYEAISGDEIAIGWCAEDDQGLLATFETLMKKAGMADEEEEEASDTQEVVCQGKLPVRVQVFSPSRMNAYVLEEIVSIQATGVSDDRFEIPEGYTEKKLSDMWK